MPKVDKRPKPLRLYESYGLDITWTEGEKDAKSDCPFCSKEKKLGIRVETGQYHCWSCGQRGNSTTFIEWLWGESDNATTDFSSIQEDRELLFPETPMKWGVTRSLLTDRWLVPGYSAEGKVRQLYRYMKLNGKKRLLAGVDIPHQLHGLATFDKNKSTVYVCEGPWDGMALYEMLGNVYYDEDKDMFRLTADESRSLLSDSNVVAVPGCNVPVKRWAGMFANKRVVLCYDNDHPHKGPKGKPIEPGSICGMRRVAIDLLAHKSPPDELLFMKWGPNGFDPKLPDGHDIRDMLGSGPLEARLTGFRRVMGRLTSIPTEWVKSAEVAAVTRGNVLECKPCDCYIDVIAAWEQALLWFDGLDRSFSVMLASIISTMVPGDQLWVKIIGPAACGKSTLCEALSVAKRYIEAKSTISGFHSGFKTDGDGTEDNSLLSRLNGKTLIVKDGDTLLQRPNLPQILSEARDIYDGTSRTHYRNAVAKDYEGIRMTWILCGTSSLRSIDTSELGERFLDCVVMDDIDEEMESKISERAAQQSFANMSLSSSSGAAMSRQPPEMTEAMQMAGGYASYLRENADRLLGQITMKSEYMSMCGKLGKFIAYMRARPSQSQEETAEREVSTRLTSQLVRLAVCLAAVLNKTAVDKEVMSRVRAVAMDTARGQVYEIADRVYPRQMEGVKSGFITSVTGLSSDKTAKLVTFLNRIGVLERYKKTRGKMASEVRIRLTETVEKLYEEVVMVD